jgi:hypothetical protein
MEPRFFAFKKRLIPYLKSANTRIDHFLENSASDVLKKVAH